MLEEKVAIVTGAERGMGAAEVRLFVAERARVVLTDIDMAGAAVRKQIGAPAMFVQHDVADAAGWERVGNQAVEQHGSRQRQACSSPVSSSAFWSSCGTRKSPVVFTWGVSVLQDIAPANDSSA